MIRVSKQAKPRKTKARLAEYLAKINRTLYDLMDVFGNHSEMFVAYFCRFSSKTEQNIQ